MIQNKVNQLIDKLTPEQQLKMLELLKLEKQFKVKNRLDHYYTDSGPNARENYPKHVQFMNAGSRYRQRAFIAGNQSGKTLTCSYETAIHLTGLYPDWWNGYKFKKPIRAWAVGTTAQKVRDNIQNYLLGPLWSPGTGMIPGDLIAGVPTPSSSNVSGLKMDIPVKHFTNGIEDGVSWLTLKAYQQGREVFQGEQLDLIWLDEEDKDQQGIYSECITRFATTDGLIICSFTPLYSLSDMVISFLPDLDFPEGGSGPTERFKWVTNVTWDDVPHITEDKKEELLSAYKPEEREARTKGIPGLGAGLIYPVDLKNVTYRPTSEITRMLSDMPKAYAMDIAYTSGVTAVLWGAYEADFDTWWIYDEYYVTGQTNGVHAEAIKAKGVWIEGVIDPSSEHKVNKYDELRIIEDYENKGLILTKANNSLYQGIQAVYEGLVSGRIKISIKCEKLLWELKQYRKDEKGKIVDKNDHACDSLRYLIMSAKDVLQFKPSEEDEDDDSPWNRSPRYRDPYTGY